MSQHPEFSARKKEIRLALVASLEAMNRAVVDAGGVVVFEDDNFHRRVKTIVGNTKLTRGMAESLFYMATISGNSDRSGDERALLIVELLLNKFSKGEADPWWQAVWQKIEAGPSYDLNRGDKPFTPEMAEAAALILLKTKSISSEKLIKIAEKTKSEMIIGHLLIYQGIDLEMSTKILSVCQSRQRQGRGLIAYLELVRARELEPKVELLVRVLIEDGPVSVALEDDLVQWILDKLPEDRLWGVISQAAVWHPKAVSEWLRRGGRGKLNEWPKATVKQLMGSDSKEVRMAVAYALTSARQLV